MILALFLVGVLVAVSFIGFDYLKASACTTTTSTNVWEGQACLNATGDTEVDITAIDKIAIVEAVVDIALGLLSLVVLMLIFKLVIDVAKGFAKGTAQ